MLLAADWVYLAAYITISTGGLLHHPFTLTVCEINFFKAKITYKKNFRQTWAGGLLSVALALGLPQPSVRWNPALQQPGLSSRPCLRDKFL